MFLCVMTILIQSSTSADSVIERDELDDQVNLIPARSNNLSIQSNISPR